MGTRADFYLRNENTEPKMKWLGSVALDGYPEGIDNKVLKATTDQEFITEVDNFLNRKSHATFVKDGWPWPWDNSQTTDYAYICESGKVMASSFGSALFDPTIKPSEDEENESKIPNGYFPDMTDIKNVQWGDKSGLIILGK